MARMSRRDIHPEGRRRMPPPQASLRRTPGRFDAKPLGLPIGSQTWPHRAMIKDGRLAALAAALAEIGVEAVEMCSPFGYEEFARSTDGKRGQEDPGRSWPGVRERPLRHGRAANEAGGQHRVGARRRHHADGHRDARRGGDTPDARPREAGGGRIQQDRRRARRRPASSRACTTRASSSRRSTAGGPTTSCSTCSIPRSSSSSSRCRRSAGLRRRRVLHEVSRPVQLDAPAGRRPERRAAAAGREAARERRRADARSARAASTG